MCDYKHVIGSAMELGYVKSAFKEAEIRYCAVLALFSEYGFMLSHATIVHLTL